MGSREKGFEIPEGLSADYVNEPVEEALRALHAQPDYERLAHFLEVLRGGYLFVDVTGGVSKKKTRIRMVRATSGESVLPIFTSVAQIRAAQGPQSAHEVKGALMPALDALRLIHTSGCVAVELNPAGDPNQIFLRKFIELAISEGNITPETLQNLSE